MLTYYLLLCLHVLGACVWVGGHLVLAIRILPRALREKNAALVREFEQGYEPIGLTALALQIVSGLWLAHRILGNAPGAWFADSGPARIVQIKLGLLAATVGLAIHARFRVVPRLRDDNLSVLGAHIVAVSALGVLFVLAGASLRFGGYPLLQP